MTEKEFIDKVLELRHTIHAFPNLSGDESETASRVLEFIKEYSADHIYENIGGNGLLVRYDLSSTIFKSDNIANHPFSSLFLNIIANCVEDFNANKQSKKTINILFRCELDALPIQEEGNLWYKSQREGISHVCGHDGHIAMMCSLAASLDHIRSSSLLPDEKGNHPELSIYLLFQPSEETGAGGEPSMNDMIGHKIEIDYGFAFHNTPGYPEGVILTYPGTYAYASAGIEIQIKGRSSHAAEPHLADNPTELTLKFIEYLNSLNALLTIVHVEIGSNTYGTTPGNAVVRITARAAKDEELDRLLNSISTYIIEISSGTPFTTSFAYFDRFPASVNSDICNSIIEKSALQRGLGMITDNHPNLASEDFAHLAKRWRCSIFGIGNGLHSKNLHDNSFDFNDKLIEII